MVAAGRRVPGQSLGGDDEDGAHQPHGLPHPGARRNERGPTHHESNHGRNEPRLGIRHLVKRHKPVRWLDGLGDRLARHVGKHQRHHDDPDKRKDERRHCTRARRDETVDGQVRPPNVPLTGGE